MKTIVALSALILIGCGPNPNRVEVTREIERTNLLCTVYDLSPGVSSLPDFGTSSAPVLSYLAIDKLDAYSTDASTPFQKFVGSSVESRTEQFGLVCTAKVKVTTAGSHQFQLTSDDGSALYVDGAKLITNDGTHGMVTKTGTRSLSVGEHKIRVEYFNNNGPKGLILAWKIPGGVFSIIDDRDFVK